jgi:hypothetical protein
VPEKTARLQDALLHLLPGQRHQSRGARSAATNHRRDGCRAEEDLGRGKPALILWQAGTFDAISGIDPEEFRTSLTEGVDAIDTAGADLDLINMRYSPRTETMLGVATYADICAGWLRSTEYRCSIGWLLCVFGTTRARSISAPPQRSMIWPVKSMIALDGRWRLRLSVRLI